MHYIKKRNRGQINWKDVLTILILSLVIVIPIALIFLDSIHAESENTEETTARKPVLELTLPKQIPMQTVPEEEQIAYDAVIKAKTASKNASIWCELANQENERLEEIVGSAKNATTLAQYTEITILAFSANSAATEAAVNSAIEAENAYQAMLEVKKAAEVVPEVCPQLDIANQEAEKAIIEANIAMDNAIQTQEITNKVIEDLDQKNHLIHTMARVIYAEAHGEPLLGKIAVGATIVNRLKSEYFPDTIEEVLEGQYARYDWVTDEHLARYPECIEAAERALMGEDPLADELGEPTVYFLNPETSVQREVEFRKTKKNATIGHHMFSGLSLYW